MQIIEVNKPTAAEAALQSGKWKKKRLVCISDTHSQHLDIIVPEGDILIHAGTVSLVPASIPNNFSEDFYLPSCAIVRRFCHKREEKREI